MAHQLSVWVRPRSRRPCIQLRYSCPFMHRQRAQLHNPFFIRFGVNYQITFAQKCACTFLLVIYYAGWMFLTESYMSAQTLPKLDGSETRFTQNQVNSSMYPDHTRRVIKGLTRFSFTRLIRCRPLFSPLCKLSSRSVHLSRA